MTIRVLIVDDFAIVRQGLRTFVGLDAEFEVVGEAADGAEGLRLARRLRPDVVLMDLLMPEMDGVAATQLIHSEMPEVEVIALTSVLEDSAVIGGPVVDRSGAHGIEQVAARQAGKGAEGDGGIGQAERRQADGRDR